MSSLLTPPTQPEATQPEATQREASQRDALPGPEPFPVTPDVAHEHAQHVTGSVPPSTTTGTWCTRYRPGPNPLHPPRESHQAALEHLLCPDRLPPQARPAASGRETAP